MKKAILYILIVLFCACTDTKLNDKTEGDKSSIKSSLSLKQISAINDLKKEYEYRKQNLSRSSMGYEEVLTHLDNYTVIPIDHRSLNVEKFYQNPTPQTLKTCFERDSNNLYFEAKQGDKTVFRFDMQPHKDHWIMRSFIPEWGKAMSWLPNKLASAKTNEYLLLTGNGDEFIAIKTNDQTKFFNLRGQEYNEEKLCEFFLNKINLSKQLQKESDDRESKREP